MPDPAARAHSARVVAAVRQAIVGAGGFLSLERYLARVLYAPSLGYYVSGTAKFGPEGDFVTAPELSPLYGRSIAAQIDAVLASTSGRQLVELGAGSGALAADVLNELGERGALPASYAIVEVSAPLRALQRATLEARAAAHVDRVAWLDAPPAHIEGAIVMNEVLDAVPCHVIVRRDGHWM